MPSRAVRKSERGWAAGRSPCSSTTTACLTPIADQPENAELEQATRGTLRSLAARFPVAIVSGRALEDIRLRVGVEGLYFAGNHGFEILGPGDPPKSMNRGEAFKPSVAAAHDELIETLRPVKGARVEHKGYSLSVHYRHVADHHLDRVSDEVARVSKRFPDLATHGGKRVLEIRPDLDWHKGRAVSWLLGQMNIGGQRHVPIFIGDDRTDEDAFHEIANFGLGVVVGTESKPTSASHCLRDTAEVEKFLQFLVDL